MIAKVRLRAISAEGPEVGTAITAFERIVGAGTEGRKGPPATVVESGTPKDKDAEASQETPDGQGSIGALFYIGPTVRRIPYGNPVWIS